MTTTTRDERALLAAIAAQPEEDTPRLMYADYLQESGQEDRAELIRVQCELANRRPYAAPDDLVEIAESGRLYAEMALKVIDAGKAEFNKRTDYLLGRERELLAAYPEWQRVTCPVLAKRKWGPSDPRGCNPYCICSGTGHLFLVLRRGFPFRVTVPRLELMGAEWTRETWDGGVSVASDRIFHPTDHARELLAVLPTCGELVPGCRKPMYLDWDGVRSHAGWWNAARYVSHQHYQFESSDLPRSVWEQLAGFDGDNDFYRGWLTADAAISALGVTLCGIVRGSA